MLVTSLILPVQFTFSHSRTSFMEQSLGFELAPTVLTSAALDHSATVGGAELPEGTSGDACPAPGAAVSTGFAAGFGASAGFGGSAVLAVGLLFFATSAFSAGSIFSLFPPQAVATTSSIPITMCFIPDLLSPGLSFSDASYEARSTQEQLFPVRLSTAAPTGPPAGTRPRCRRSGCRGG
jgi:hypothetical protein